MKRGEKRQCALWFKGHEQMKAAEQIILNTFMGEARHFNIKFGDIHFHVVDLPNPPEPGAKILMGESVIVCDGFERIDTHAFIRTLSPSDLRRLREATQKAWKKTFPSETINTYGDVFSFIAIAAALSGMICLIMSPILKRWMHEEVEGEGDETKGEQD